MDMRERIARAIADKLFPGEWPGAIGAMADCLGAADAVLAAMREPTDREVFAGYDALERAGASIDPPEFVGIWRAMIDAARAPREGGEP